MRLSPTRHETCRTLTGKKVQDVWQYELTASGEGAFGNKTSYDLSIVIQNYCVSESSGKMRAHQAQR